MLACLMCASVCASAVGAPPIETKPSDAVAAAARASFQESFMKVLQWSGLGRAHGKWVAGGPPIEKSSASACQLRPPLPRKVKTISERAAHADVANDQRA